MEEDRSSPDPHYGPWKFIEEITLTDLQSHPIWLWCMALGLAEEEDGPMGGNEASMRPLLDSRNVEGGMMQPLILLRVKDTDYFATGLYDHAMKGLVSLGIQTKSRDEITTLTKVGGLRVPTGWKAPLTFVAMPTIEGRAGVEFCCSSLDKDEARMV